jgi:ADP-heptose:LPS heptosyltransferase
MGDIALSFPAFASIRENFKHEKIFLLTEKRYYDIFKKCPYIDTCITDNRNDNYIHTFIRLIKLHRKKFNLIIDLQNSNRTSFYNLFFRTFQTSKISSSRPFAQYRYHIPSQGTETVVSGLFKQLSLIGVKKIKNNNYSWLKTDLKENFEKQLALFIPGTSKSGNYKRWQSHKFAEIAKYYEKKNYTICVVGAKEDIKSAKPTIESCNKAINKLENSPPSIIYSIALKSKIIFSNDTGPGLIASLANKNFVLLANDNKITTSNLPPGEHVYKILSSSVKNISTEEVVNFIEKNRLY